ncbi:MAG: hypothetical protein IKM49_04140 [Ruminococcus sp.]|nr:hypothetical protein [Ruminococcus sp.]
MKKAVEYIVGTAMLVVLFITALASSEHNALLTLAFSILITLLTLQSISDFFSLPVTLLQFAVSVFMGVFSSNPFCCLLLCQVRAEKLDALRIFTPALCWSITAFYSGQELYSSLFYSVVLTFVSAVIFASEKCLVRYLDTKEKLNRSVSLCALGELSEKKLNEELRIKNYLAGRNARLEERENISRSIHNSVGHSITAAIMTLDAADMLFDTSPDKAREKISTANERIRDSLASIRRAVRVLDSEDNPIPASDLCDSVDAICKSFTMDTGITVKTDTEGCIPHMLIPPVHSEFFCSCVSELISNGIRHGNADCFFVILTSDSRHLQLVVTDNGESSFSEENSHSAIQKGFGLKKIISYCEKNGGKAEFSNTAGFKSVVALPIIEEEC